MSEAVWYELRRHGLIVQHCVVSLLGFSGRDIADRLQQSSFVEPVHPFQRGELGGFERSPRSVPMNDLGFVEAVDGLGEGVVVRVADAAHRRLNPGLHQPLGVLDRDVLASAVAVVNQAAAMSGPSVVQRLLQSVEHEVGVRRPADAPADDIAGIDIDHERHVDEARPGGDISEVRDPEPVRRWSLELSIDLVERTRHRLITDRRANRLAANNALEAESPHQTDDSATGDVVPLASELTPHFAYTVDAEVLFEDPPDLDLQGEIASRTLGQQGRIPSLGQVIVVGGGGDRQHFADRLDPELRPVIVNEGDHRLSGRSSSAWAKYADALRRISLACRSSRFSRSKAFIFSATSLGTPATTPLSISAFLTHSDSVQDAQPIFAAIEVIAAHRDG